MAQHRNRRSSCHHLTARIQRSADHPPGHPVVERAADWRADGEGDRLWSGEDGGRVGGDAHLDAGEGRRRVRGPGVPEHVPSHRQERRLLLRRPPRRARHRPPAHRGVTTKWALQKYRAGEAVFAMDPRMRRSPAAVEKMIEVAEQCVAPARRDRPSMRRCTEALWTVRRDYNRRQEVPPQGASPWKTGAPTGLSGRIGPSCHRFIGLFGRAPSTPDLLKTAPLHEFLPERSSSTKSGSTKILNLAPDS